MKKLGLLFIVMMAFLMLPFSVLADNTAGDSSSSNVESAENDSNVEDNAVESSEVNVYFFHGDGCPHCAEAEEFFDSIEGEYGDLFNIVSYETWYNSENAKLLEQVAEARDETVTGVPYIVIGNKSWHGYSSDLDDEIISAIKEEYDTEVSSRYDIMDLINFGDDTEVKEDYSDDVMILIIMLIVVAGVVTGVVFARKKAA